jgi:hypothetical protein
MRNENGIMLSFRWISWHLSSLLRERSLMREQLPSLLYLTWLSLPFQYFFVIVVFATNSYSFGTGIYTLCLCRNLNDFKGVFLWTGGRKRDGGFVDAGPDNKRGYPLPSSLLIQFHPILSISLLEQVQNRDHESLLV